MEKLKKESGEQYTLKFTNIFKIASPGFNFTGSSIKEGSLIFRAITVMQ